MKTKSSLILLVFLLVGQVSYSQNNKKFIINVKAGYTFLMNGNNKWLDEPLPTNSIDQSFTYQRIHNKRLFANEIFIRADFQKGKWIIPLQIGIRNWNDEFFGDVNTRTYHPDSNKDWWELQTNENYHIYYKGSSNYLHLSSGIGYQIFSLNNNLYLNAFLKVNPEILISRESEIKKADRYFEDYINGDGTEYYPNDNIEDFIKFDETNDNTNPLLKLAPSVNIEVGKPLYKNLGLEFNLGCEWQSYSRITMSEISTNKVRYFASIAITYVI